MRTIAAFAPDLVPNAFHQLYLSRLKGPQLEGPKIPILLRSSRNVYIIALHTFAILGALTTATINLLNLRVGKDIGHRGQNGQTQFALQMAAKLQEILAVASLTDIIMSPILFRLSMGDGLPLGATTAGLRFGEVSYLWSEDFIATCSAKFSRKYLLIISIVVSSLLSLTVGPASATAMTPKQSDWLAGQVQFCPERIRCEYVALCSRNFGLTIYMYQCGHVMQFTGYLGHLSKHFVRILGP